MFQKIKKPLIPNTLFGRLITLPSFAVIISFLLIVTLIGYNQYIYAKEEIQKFSSLVAKELSVSLEKYLLLHDYGEVESIMRRFTLIESIHSMTLINEQHKSIISVEKKSSGELDLKINEQKDFTFLAKHEESFLDENSNYFFIYKPIPLNSQNKWIIIEINKKFTFGKLINLFFFALTVAFIFIILLSYLIYRIIKKPFKDIEELTSFATNLHQNFGTTCKIKSSIEEIKNLTFSLNQLSLKLLRNDHTMKEQNKNLQIFNEELSSRVQKEVEKNREKDIMLLNNARLVALAEMIGNIAHQWRQPLNSIGLHMQSLQLSYELGELDSEEFNSCINDAMMQVEYLSQTIDDFRDLTKNSSTNEAFEISKLVQKTFALVESSFKNNSVATTLEIEPNLSYYGNANALSQAIINILNNAKDAFSTKEIASKKLHATLKKQEDVLLLEICDNAGGVPDEIIEKIFDPYFTTKHQANGTGLGLYISKKIIEQELFGNLKVENKNGGACFSIFLKSLNPNA